MKLFVFLIFASCAVKCDEAGNYYVIERPLDSPLRGLRPFQVYWNVPTFQCKSKKVTFDHLFEKYGIIQNQNDSFLGEQIAILYDPGLFPAILKDESSGKLRTRNGGVPQEGNLDEHLTAFRYVLDQSIPDPEFSGIGVVDFESWRPVFRQNSWGVLTPYRNLSLLIERRRHPWWTKTMIEKEAKFRFERYGREFMQATLALARLLRPKAKWGYYGFPYCFNMAGAKPAETCSDNIQAENDQITWLWSESTVLTPSVYSSKTLDSAQLAALIRGRVTESARVGRGLPILPYFWFKYRDAGFMTEMDLKAALKALYKSHTSGFILWGSSNDVNTVTKCEMLKSYLKQVLGPEIAKYTRQTMKIDESYNINNDTETNDVSTQNPIYSMINFKDVENVDSENEEMNETSSEIIQSPLDDEIMSINDSDKVKQEHHILIDIVLSLIENMENRYDKEAEKTAMNRVASDKKKGTPIHDTFIKLGDNDTNFTTKSPINAVKKKGSLFASFYPIKNTTEINNITSMKEESSTISHSLKSTTVEMLYESENSNTETTEFNKKSSTVEVTTTGHSFESTTIDIFNETENPRTTDTKELNKISTSVDETSTAGHNFKLTTVDILYDIDNFSTSVDDMLFDIEDFTANGNQDKNIDGEFNNASSVSYQETTAPILFDTNRESSVTTSTTSSYKSDETTVPIYFDNEDNYTVSNVSSLENVYEESNTTEDVYKLKKESKTQGYGSATYVKGSTSDQVLSTTDSMFEDIDEVPETVYDDPAHQEVAVGDRILSNGSVTTSRGGGSDSMRHTCDRDAALRYLVPTYGTPLSPPLEVVALVRTLHKPLDT